MKMFFKKWIIALALFAFPCAARAATLQVHTFGNYETAGVIITLPAGTNGNETAKAGIKGPNDADYQPAHDFVRYDLNNMATSMFNLSPGTEYDVRIEYSDPDGSPINAYAKVSTRPEFTMPVPKRTVTVSPGESGTNTLQDAINSALPGDEIRVKAGAYSAIRISNRILTADSPIVVRADDPANKPIIDGGGSGVSFSIAGSSYWIIDGFEIKNGGTIADGDSKGVYIDYSSHIIVQNCYIHDNGYYNMLINHDFKFPNGSSQGGFHLIQDNTIAMGNHGIQQDNGVGAQTVIRRNIIRDHWDNVKVCGNEGEDLSGNWGGGARNLSENTAHVLALTGGTWFQHDTDFYENTCYICMDNDIELDGIGVNIRVFRNKFISDNIQSPISIAPSMPGPFFITRNLIKGQWLEGAFKMNTAGQYNIPERNVFVYHNTFVKTGGSGVGLIYLWYDLAWDHDVPVKNIIFKNNLFVSQLPDIQCTDSKNSGRVHPQFDYNLWYVPGTNSWRQLFEWQTSSSVTNYTSFADFQAGTGQEANGLFADPLLDVDSRLSSESSPAKDKGVQIPGINNDFSGTGPDIGAYEFIPKTAVNAAPIVSAGIDITITLPNSANLQGAVKDDGLPEVSSVSSAWTVVFGAGSVTFADASAINTTASFSAAGSYTLRLTGTDGEKSTSDDIAVTVNASSIGNQAPVVNAGLDQNIPWPVKTASLKGTVSDDGLPVPPGKITHQWTLFTGPGVVTFSDPYSLNAAVTFPKEGTYVLRLTGFDGQKYKSDHIIITVSQSSTVNQAPTVSAGNDITITLPSAANLQGTISDDGLPVPPGKITHQWTLFTGSGAVAFADAYSLNTTVTFSKAGTYVLRLTGFDGQKYKSDHVIVIVNAS